MSDDIHIAYYGEGGIQARCPTTGEAYIAAHVQFTRINNQRAVWCSCRWCDTELRTRVNPSFDPSQPQKHLYILSETHHANPTDAI